MVVGAGCGSGSGFWGDRKGSLRGTEGAEFSRREKAAELNQRFDDAEDGRRELVLQC